MQDILPPGEVSGLFRIIHLQFLKRVADRLREGRVKPDNSPAHGLVVSELIFYRNHNRDDGPGMLLTIDWLID